jgi:fatty acid-binding protein DegV
MAALALGGNAAAAAALAGFGADFAAVRSAVKAHRERTLLQRVAELGRAL